MESPVNGGRNSNDPKVNSVALVKPNHMLESPQKLRSTRSSFKMSSENDQDMGTISRKDFQKRKNPQRLYVREIQK